MTAKKMREVKAWALQHNVQLRPLDPGWEAYMGRPEFDREYPKAQGMDVYEAMAALRKLKGVSGG